MLGNRDVARGRVPSILALAAGRSGGMVLAVALAAMAQTAESWLRAPGVLVALVLGLCWSGVGQRAPFAPGLGFAATTLLRLGVALLGVRIALPQIAAAGWGGVTTALAAVAVTLAAGLLVGRALGLERRVALLVAGATAICGASAALALAAATSRRDEAEADDVAGIVAAVTLVGSAAMAAYAGACTAFGASAATAGIFLGASLHEVAQAVGAGYAVSPAAGDLATLVKMVRVACLAPVVVLAALWLGPPGRSRTAAAPPGFLLAFLVLATAASLGLIPTGLRDTLGDASRFLLLTALAALGARVSPRRLFALGLRPLAALLVLSLVVGAVALAGAFLSTSA